MPSTKSGVRQTRYALIVFEVSQRKTGGQNMRQPGNTSEDDTIRRRYRARSVDSRFHDQGIPGDPNREFLLIEASISI